MATQSPQFNVDIREIRKHYDRLSIFYRLLWGEHLHHGYWENGESIARAQIKLMEKLAERAGIPDGATVLDIGCGLGGSAFWLAEQYNCQVTGLTISPVQAQMASRRARAKGLDDRVRFLVEDANVWSPQSETVDAIWIMESSEHFRDKPNFFDRCASALKSGGVLAICAWLRGKRSTEADRKKLVETIGRAMLSASLDTLNQYVHWMGQAGLIVESAEDITANIAPTWKYCSQMAERWPMRWLTPLVDGPTRQFIKSFPLMTEAYATEAMAFGLFVAHKRSQAS
jgi:tocopherol O-methyltransferase